MTATDLATAAADLATALDALDAVPRSGALGSKMDLALARSAVIERARGVLAAMRVDGFAPAATLTFAPEAVSDVA